MRALALYFRSRCFPGISYFFFVVCPLSSWPFRFNRIAREKVGKVIFRRSRLRDGIASASELDAKMMKQFGRETATHFSCCREKLIVCTELLS